MLIMVDDHEEEDPMGWWALFDYPGVDLAADLFFLILGLVFGAWLFTDFLGVL